MRIQLNASELARVNQRISEYAKTIDKDVSRVFVLTLLSQIFGDQLEEALNKGKLLYIRQYRGDIVEIVMIENE